MTITKSPIKFILALGSLFFIIFVIIIFKNPILGKFLTGTARIIENENISEIYIDGERQSNAKLYAVKSNFDETRTDNYLVLYLRDIEDHVDFPVLIIDGQNGKVFYPNASLADYDIVFGKLFQSDSGANVMVSLDNPSKGPGFNPQLKIEKKNITFKVPFRNKIKVITINIA